jgi:hypothetical protein
LAYRLARQANECALSRSGKSFSNFLGLGCRCLHNSSEPISPHLREQRSLQPHPRRRPESNRHPNPCRQAQWNQPVREYPARPQKESSVLRTFHDETLPVSTRMHELSFTAAPPVQDSPSAISLLGRCPARPPFRYLSGHIPCFPIYCRPNP